MKNKRLLLICLTLLISACLIDIPFLSAEPSIPEPTRRIIPLVTTTPSQIPTITPIHAIPDQNTIQIQQTLVKPRDLNELAIRFLGVDEKALAADPEDEKTEGMVENFYVVNLDTTYTNQVSAKLTALSPHAFLWVEQGVTVAPEISEYIIEKFEADIYPNTRRVFGEEWSPGIDNDLHVYILYTRGAGTGVYGYFSAKDEYSRAVHPYSNQHEMFIINADDIDLRFTEDLIAHELQHMIQWYQDRNEYAWLNEGLSELALLLSGDPPFLEYQFPSNTDLQLNYWPTDFANTIQHYEAAYLFVTYLHNRFGESFTRTLVSEPADGMNGIDAALSTMNKTHPDNGEILTAKDVFADWAVALYLNSENLAYQSRYQMPPNLPGFKLSIGQDMGGYENRGQTYHFDVHQFGIDTLSFSAADHGYSLLFVGDDATEIAPISAHSGKYMLYSNRGDKSNMRLTREFDFRQVEAPIEMRYWAWFDIEKNYDYAYLSASTDGKRWHILQTSSCRTSNPNGNSYGCGYTGSSGNSGLWIEETVNLSPYAGQVVQLAFDYITDDAANGTGLLLDDFSIPAIGYATDFENDNGGWQPDGFIRIDNEVQQPFIISLVRHRASGVDIERIYPDENNTAEIEINPNQQAVLFISGAALNTDQKAHYNITFLEEE
jgi:hypothetical protein